MATENDGPSPWCVLDSHTMNIKQCACGECDVSVLVDHIANRVYSDEELNALVTYAIDPSTGPFMFADSVYLFVNKCIRQRIKIPVDTSNAITARIADTLADFSTLTTSYWITKVLLDLYEQDQHVLDSPNVHKCITYLLNVYLHAELRDEDATVVMNAISALVTLVSGMFCYGVPDHELEGLDLPVEVERPDDARNLECVFDDPAFCSGLVRILVYGTTMFDKWFGRESLFHWDLAILALVIKNRVLKVPALCNAFIPKVIETLFELSADYSSLIIIAKTRPLPWKRLVLECISIVLTGSNSYLLGIALVDQTSGTRRFGVFLNALLKHYGTVEKIREACIQSNCSPPPVARAVGMLMSLSGRDHGHISRMMRRLRQQVGTSGAIAADPNPPPSAPEPAAPAPKEETLSKVSDLERDIIFQQLIQEEEESRRRSSAASSVASSSKKKKGKKNKPQKKPTVVVESVDSEPEPAADEDVDDDACIYQRLGLERAAVQSKKEEEVLPFGPPAKKRTHRKRKPIKPLPTVLETPPSPPEPETTSEPVPVVLPEPEATPEPVPVVLPEPEATSEPVPVVLPEPEATSEPSLNDPEWVEKTVHTEPQIFAYAHEWTGPFQSGSCPVFPDRQIAQFLDVLRWTPLVYAYSARRSFEKQVGVRHIF